MSVAEAYIIRCDTHCGALRVYDARIFLPQQALVHVMNLGWTVYDEKAHCPDCPPLCWECGAECDHDEHVCTSCDGQG